MNDLDPTLLRRALNDWVPELRYLPATDSTNRQALAWAGAGARHGSLVVANFQTAGRGRLDRTWLAPAGSSLLFSVILRSGWAPQHRGLLSLAAAVAVCEGLEELGVEAAVKWPNDVLVGSRKLCGILGEAAGGVVVLGVGMNVKQKVFPEQIESAATSLELCAGREFHRSKVLAEVIRHLGPLVDGPAEAVPGRYRRWCTTLGNRVRVNLALGMVEDVAVDVDEAGDLVLAGGVTVTAGDVLQLR